MNLERIFTDRITKEQNNEIYLWIGESQAKFDQLMPFLLEEDYRLCQRASWVFGKVCENRPELMMKWMPKILKALDKPKHAALVRNVVRAWQFMNNYPEEYEGEIYNRCFDYLSGPDQPIAVKVFCMTVCRKIAMKHPDLKSELIMVISENINHGSTGMKNRGANELQMLQ
ncbi:hypothetical protein [Portibacter marinus]|uniref:hypothetical protein n=1 Tax=Portibacter marinus TaxID=2898660 RepID=UPI001F3C8109|nr:hypothetical protein [Portibacter marinus]